MRFAADNHRDANPFARAPWATAVPRSHHPHTMTVGTWRGMAPSPTFESEPTTKFAPPPHRDPLWIRKFCWG
ncbi:hypothetical protein E2542_SST01469 [Spatholobus suberectus]|nr:hypothetical protein E2542_SST01469 [Spatholobus suberectus]